MGQEGNRYKRIGELDILEICPSCKVELQKGALLWDTKSKQNIMQLKFCNYSDKILKSLYITYDCKDDQGKMISQKGFCDITFSYIDVNCEPHSVFGTKTPILLPSELVRNVDVFIKTIVWEDNSITNISKDEYIKVENQKILSVKLSEDDIEAYRRVCNLPESELFLPRELDANVWQCACHSINLEQNCRNCKSNRKEQFSYLDEERLITFKQEYAKEVLQKELEKEAEATKKKQKRVKKYKLITVITIAVAIFAIIATVLASSYVKNSTRRSNVQKLQNDYNSYAITWDKKKLINQNYEDFKELFNEEYDNALFPELDAVPCGNPVRIGNTLYQIVDTLLFCLNTASSEANYKTAYETAQANGVTGVLLKKDLSTGTCKVIHVFENPDTFFTPKKTFIGIIPKYIAGIENDCIYVQLLDNYSDHYFFNRIGEYNLTNGEYKVIEIEDSKDIEVKNGGISTSRLDNNMMALVKDNKYYFYKNEKDKAVYCYDLISKKSEVRADITANR